MKIGRIIRLPLAKPLLRFAALVMASAAIAMAAHEVSREASAQHARESERRDELRAASASDGDSARFRQRYREWLARGAIGVERRPDWVKQLAITGEARHVVAIEYEFSPQQPAAIEGIPTEAGRHRFMVSAMKLHLAVAHEQDLLGFLDDLVVSVSSVLRVRACTIERLAETEAPVGARLAADCTVDWMTLQRAP